MAAVERYERLERRLIRRRLQRDLADIVITMARSRAETVVHTLTPTPGRPVTSRKGDAELLADALAHLGWVERNSPTPDERKAARRIEEALAARAAGQWAIVQSATARLGQAPAMDVVVYAPRHQAPAAVVTPSRFSDRNWSLIWRSAIRARAGRDTIGLTRLGERWLNEVASTMPGWPYVWRSIWDMRGRDGTPMLDLRALGFRWLASGTNHKDRRLVQSKLK